MNNKEEKKYIITQEQLEIIEHYKLMFQLEAEKIKELCFSEKDDIVYGFELGKTYFNLMDCFMNMMILEEEIKQQIFKK